MEDGGYNYEVPPQGGRGKELEIKMKKLCDLSSLSQAYVFYKLSQTQVISFYKFKPILQYHGTSLFLKNEIKDYFEKHGVSHSRLRHHYGLRQKILRSHYQYNLVQNRWLKLVPRQWRNRIRGTRMLMDHHSNFLIGEFFIFVLEIRSILSLGSIPVPRVKPWIIPIKLLLFNFNGNRNINKNITKNKKRDSLIAPNEKQIIGLENQNQEEKEPIGEGGMVSDAQKQGNFKSVLSNQEKDVEEDYDKSNKKKSRKKKQYKSKTEAELDFFLKRYLRFQLRWDDSLNKKIINNIKYLTLRELIKKEY
ncbi:hypothetical protein ES288_D01G053000v1 [Gossypium darwinii]|uniref:Uncharacterized protein n=1 Tax=Gossypium darwinii TaxID=34276 RepID=A0A5D2DLU9_GOSDA|nr:hypothetical protein ES288_D01G053000v1 [Gossypium darwinii]